MSRYEIRISGYSGIPKCTVVENREDHCLKCHMYTTGCKLRAITID